MNSNHLELKLARATSLPLLPAVVHEILSLTDGSGANVRDYERVIMKDAALAAKILRTANTAYYGGKGDIGSVGNAIQRLGISATRSLCMSTAFHSALSSRTLHKSFDAAGYWRHSLGVACSSKILCVLTGYSSPEEGFLAGLLHDIGKLAICMFLQVQASCIYTLMGDTGISQYDAEMQILESTHEEVGKLAACHWKIPAVFHAPIAHHHHPEGLDDNMDQLTAIVHVSNYLAHSAGMPAMVNEPAFLLNHNVLNILGVKLEQCVPITNVVANEVAQLCSQMGV